MKFCVTFVYWALLFISVVSSGLLFLIVASENAEETIETEVSKNDESFYEFNNSTITDESEKYEIPEIQIARVQKAAIEDEYLEDSPTKVTSSFDTLNALDDHVENDVDVLAESIIQQPNLSQGISETGQAVVLTLVDTAAAELQSLAEPKIELDSHSSVKNSSTKGGRRYSEDVHDAKTSSNQLPSSPIIKEESIEEDNDTNNVLLNEDEVLGLHGTTNGKIHEKTPDIVVVVRAEQQKIAVDGVDVTRTEVRSEEEEEGVEQVLQDELGKVEEEDFGTASELNDTAARVRLISGGNRDDVASAVIIDGLVASGPSDSHEDIPSFSEWAQKRLEEAEKKKTHPNASVQNPGGPGRSMGGMKVRSKNYASPDCGAKIVAVNPEAQHAKSVLAATRDEYMLNTCTSRVWFVVELCEAIQAKKIELANFELFSSSPKEFSVYVSDRFPTRDWSPVGHFTAKDERDIQSFALHPQLFGQFIKVELQSHYGSEHFCPISLFRAYGTSEFEVLETETENQLSREPTEDDEDNDEEEILDADGVPSNLFGSARDAVLSIVKKAAEVLVKSSDLIDNNITKIQQNIDTGTILKNSYNSCTTPRYTILCAKCSDQKFAKVFQLVGCRDRQLDDLLKNNLVNETLRESGLCADHGVDFSTIDQMKKEHLSESKSNAKNLQATFFSSVFNPEYIVALCNVLATKERKVVMNTSYEIPGSESENITQKDPTLKIESTDKTSDLPVVSSSSQIITPSITSSSKDSRQRQESSSEELETTSTTLTGSLTNGENLASQIKPMKTLSKEDLGEKEPSLSSSEIRKEMVEETLQGEMVTTAPLVTTSPTPTLKIIEDSSVYRATETITQTAPSVPMSNYAGQEINSNLPSSIIESGESVIQSKTEKTERAENVGTKKLEQVEIDSKGKGESGEQEGKLSSQDHLNFDSLLSDLKDLENDAINLHNGPVMASNTQPTASTTPQQKESVFLRLSNRIKALERNMSLSGQYLEELSRRYKKQVEEMQRSLERAVTAMSEESRKSDERDSKRLEEIAMLREEIVMLSNLVENIVHDQNSWHGRFSAIGQHALFICLEVFVIIIVLSYCRRANDYEEEDEEQSLSKKNTARRRQSVEHLSSLSTLNKRIKKRRPSEIASNISSTYCNLMIEDHCHETKKERKKKRKKEANAAAAAAAAAKLITDIKEKKQTIKYKSTSSLVPSTTNNTLIPTKRASSSSDPPKIEDIQQHGGQQQHSQTKDSSLEYTDIASKFNNEDKVISNTKVLETTTTTTRERNVEFGRMEGGGGGGGGSGSGSSSSNNSGGAADYIETRLFSINPDRLSIIPVSTSQTTDFSKNGSSKYSGILKEGRLSSPSFMKTALGARKKRSFINNTGQSQSQQQQQQQQSSKEDKWETNSGNSSSDRSSSHKESPVTSRTLLVNLGNVNGSAANGLLDESDESRSNSVTPTSWKKEKKSSGLKKMVRKIF
ncbi:PREDICTED: SUN domain-containing ossification factor isoform X2 [Polistes dominula]|uniref:SUN domain-containing ossification factor isoform X2 n=1 Tax=Polistes dominula TaxID=743375 RepID=A0ABM1ISL2_POLDO|nr:PREDICTED: SUN domain-containing ossification factor isoform X2 [Polistes dominula]